MISQLSPYDVLKAGKWHSALFTTFSLSLSFFEAVALHALRTGGARDIGILADIVGYRASLSEAGVADAGRSYNLVPLSVAGGRFFHPKIMVLVGEDGAHAERWGEFALGRGDWRFDRVAVALDTAGDRIGLQGSLPRWIANAWTRDIALGVSRHEFLSEGPCLACLYMPDGAVKPEDVRVAEEIGLPEAVMEVRHLLATNAPVDAAFVARIVARLALPLGSLDAFVGSPLRSFYQQAICGGVVFRLTEGSSRIAATVPMAFQSALAGIMLAAELVKHALGVPASPVVGMRLNLLRPLTGHYDDPRARDRSGRCLCADPDFLGAYRRKYEAVEAT